LVVSYPTTEVVVNNRFWTDEEIDIALGMVADGARHQDIATRLGRGLGSVEAKIRAMRKEGVQRGSPSSDQVIEFQNAALDSEVEDLQSQIDNYREVRADGVSVECEWEDDWDGLKEWARAEQRAIKDIHKAKTHGRFNISFASGPIAISCISDQHIAPGSACDFKRMREDAELIRDTPGFYAVFGGDGVDNHIKHRSAMIGAKSSPDDQWRLFDYYLQIFGDKILTIISGNHDYWTKQIGGVDFLASVAKDRKICYAPAEARLRIDVAGQEYSMLVRHQAGRFNSSLNQTHVVKRFWEMNEEPFDIGVIGHHHVAALEMFIKHGEKRYAARPGSYQITSPYAHQYGFSRSIPTCPTFILFPDEKRIVGFDDVRDALWAWEKR
tara:strand:- start:180 stop:1328 length:1149 start_codon:yes stop_codon:yes gene_type:complete